ncbi:aspartyl-phosphate phosphatase Spo0E family protein [Sporosarcina sp. CAU 1771]
MRKIILLGRIKLKQKNMYKQAKNYGRSHPRVIKSSQQLDTLLNQYQGF